MAALQFVQGILPSNEADARTSCAQGQWICSQGLGHKPHVQTGGRVRMTSGFQFIDCRHNVAEQVPVQLFLTNQPK